MAIMLKTRITALIILLLGVGIGFFVYKTRIPFRLGLDLSGGTELVYHADVSKVASNEVADSMDALRGIIERRINIFGVSEPIIRVENGGLANPGEERLVVDLPGVTDVSKAIDIIGQTPVLEFRIQNPNPPTIQVDKNGHANIDVNSQYIPTGLTGRYLTHSNLTFDPTTGEPTVELQFNAEGATLFEKITRESVGKTIAIYLDGQLVQAPTVRQAITGGRAQISGGYTAQQAKDVVKELNSGALPVPINLISTSTVGPTLGTAATNAGIKAALIGFLAIALFLIIWYRLPGMIAVIALSMYVAIMLAIFKLLPVTLTAAGIAGFIISIGIAVDANVLIFERIKEELRAEHTITESINNGFSRAWNSIRDSNLSSMITAVILFWFGTTLIQGFALVFLIGIIVSMISAISITRLFLKTLNIKKTSAFTNFLFGK
jgi:preprotein translocase subunit SecD